MSQNSSTIISRRSRAFSHYILVIFMTFFSLVLKSQLVYSQKMSRDTLLYIEYYEKGMEYNNKGDQKRPKNI
jgi:hypothetical protein